MPLVPDVRIFPVYPQGEYLTYLEEVKEDVRQAFGSKEANDKNPCYKFAYLYVDDKDKPILIDGDEVRFYIATGTSYGSKQAALTKLTNQMIGRGLDKKVEAPRFDYEKLVKHHFKLLVAKEDDDDGEARNRITGMTAIPAVDIASCLIPE